VKSKKRIHIRKEGRRVGGKKGKLQPTGRGTEESRCVNSRRLRRRKKKKPQTFKGGKAVGPTWETRTPGSNALAAQKRAQTTRGKKRVEHATRGKWKTVGLPTGKDNYTVQPEKKKRATTGQKVAPRGGPTSDQQKPRKLRGTGKQENKPGGTGLQKSQNVCTTTGGPRGVLRKKLRKKGQRQGESKKRK